MLAHHHSGQVEVLVGGQRATGWFHDGESDGAPDESTTPNGEEEQP